jgi:hypothetical protein
MDVKRIEDEEDDGTQVEYDFSKGVRGKHAAAYQQGYRVIIHRIDGTVEERDYTLPDGVIALDPDIRPYFPDTESVNNALRGLIQLIPRRSSLEKINQ